jgi:MHS family proline/betaine transporter-like MFS transporter
MKPYLAKDKKKVSIIAGVIGNVIEWYDFALYGYMAAIISHLFFPNESRAISLLSTYGIFAAGFVMRPFGSAVFGWLGDTIGRSKTMLISVAVMMIPTFLLGLLPAYSSIGIFAPILLVVLRLTQGLSVGGEFSSSVTYLVETSSPGRRGLAGSLGNVGGGIGMVFGSLMAALTTNILTGDMVNAWGWRIPFLLGGVLGTVALILRRYLPKSKHFYEHVKNKENSTPIKEAFSRNRKETTQAMLFASGYGALFYLTMVYLPTWLSEYMHFPLKTAMSINTAATALLTILVPINAWISDKYIRRTKFMSISVAVMSLAAIPLFLLLRQGGIAVVIAVQFLLTILISVLSGVGPALFVELFPTDDRLSGYSIAFNVGMGIVGGSTPMVVTWLISKTNLVWLPGIYMCGWALVCFSALLWMKDRSREPLR